ncbi:cAMP-dependent protein kinase catalytic subunit 1-like [Lycorma delicatula]|uniref:cAMP-dependent protein kinase catalytic subunit 1-like n=1 Tax=Lycorma delicatula TaxID=130591 RepID=UPI003F514234
MAAPKSLFPRASVEGIPDYKAFLKKDKPRFDKFFNEKITYSVKLDDFDRLTTLGAGTYGRVMLIKHKGSENYYALKVLDKKKVIALEQVEHTLYEKKILQSINFPFLVHMDFCFYDNSNLYFVLPFIMGGEMFNLLKKMTQFDENQSKFYAAQVCMGLDYLHYLDLVYRDLKPENILIDSSGYLKITDFGFCKLVKGRTYTLCGTPEYIAPEIVLSRGYSTAVDWWSFGILVYEMNCGYAPFTDKDPMRLYDKIAAGKYKTPQHFSIGLRDLIKNLLQTDLSKRFGNLKNGADDIREHRWFKQINWVALLNKKLEPPYKPAVKGPKDTSQFEKYNEEPLRISATDRYAKEFANF